MDARETLERRIDELCREILERRIDELCAEVERLRQENQSIGMAAYELGRASLAAENAKLRELVAEIYEDQCDGSERWRYRDRMRELGIPEEA